VTWFSTHATGGQKRVSTLLAAAYSPHGLGQTLHELFNPAVLVIWPFPSTIVISFIVQYLAPPGRWSCLRKNKHGWTCLSGNQLSLRARVP
jgi:hypothetical protein